MESLTDIERFAAKLMLNALQKPTYQIAYNAGESGDVVVNTIKHSSLGWGYNAATNEYCDLLLAGVLDPTKVVKSLIQNAVSIAALFLTTLCAIADIPQKELNNQMQQDY